MENVTSSQTTKQWFRPTDMCEHYGCGASTLYRWVQQELMTRRSRLVQHIGLARTRSRCN